MTAYALGRLVQHDPRSKRAEYRAAQAPLKTVTHRHSGGVLEQGALGSCTGNAITQALNTAPLRHGRRLLNEDDAVKLYSRATQVDEFDGAYPPDDTGSSGLAVCKAAQEAGYISAYHHAFGLDQALGALVVSPIIIGITWYNQMFTPDAHGYLHIAEGIAGGHEVALIGINVRLRRVTVLNSWGSGWGNKGCAYLRWADLDALLQDQGDATVPVL